MEYLDKPLIKSDNYTEFFVNDSSELMADYILEFQNILVSHSLKLISRNASIYPSNYEEDFVQKFRRDNFKITEWIIIGLFINQSTFEIEKGVLVYKYNTSEGFIYDCKENSICCLFFRGFYVEEDEKTGKLSHEVFLDTLGITNKNEQLLINYDENVDFENSSYDSIEELLLKFNSFEANTKKKIHNFGNFVPTSSDTLDDEDDFEIEIELPKFESNSKGKIKNLGYVSNERKSENFNRKTPIENKEVEKPLFVAYSSKKVTNLGYSSYKPKHDINKTRIEENNIAENQKPTIESSDKNKIIENSIPKLVSDKWAVIDIYKMKPNVYEGEHCIINHKDFSSEIYLFRNAVDILSGVKSLSIADDCVFVPKSFELDNPIFSSIKCFNVNEYKPIVLLLGADNELLQVALHNDNLSLIVNLKDLSIATISTIGFDLDDRALPYYTFKQLLFYIN